MILEDNEVALNDARFDQPPEAVRRFGLIAASARTGSHLLCRLLRQLGYGIGLEYFYPGYRQGFEARWQTGPTPSGYLSAIMRHRTAGGYCVVKCLPHQWSAFQAAVADGVTVPEPFVIHLWRRDSLAQAISLRLAAQSGFWNFTAEPTTRPRENLDVEDLAALRKARRGLIVDEMLWRAWLGDSPWPVIHLCYEDLVADREASLRRLIAWMDPGWPGGPLPELTEPPSPEALHARQTLGPAQRAALAEAYRAQFGQSAPLPDL